MKAQFLKIAGVKNEKEFYEKFPTEESFMAKYGKQIKKAQAGINANTVSYLQQIQSVPNIQNVIQGQIQSTGVNSGMFPMNNPNIGSNYGSYSPGNYNSWDVDNNGIPDIGQSAETTPLNNIISPSNEGISPNSKMSGVMGSVGKIIGGIQALDAEKQQRRQATQMRKVSDVVLKASTLRPEMIERRYNRPEDNITTGEQLFPVYGVGTNYLAKNGKKIKKAQDGEVISSLMSVMGNVSPNLHTSAGGQIGGGIGSLAGSAFGPMGSQIGGMAGSIIGNAIDRNPSRIKREREKTYQNIMNAGINQNVQGLQSNYAGFMQDGGDIPSMEQQGELRTYWGGEAEQMSVNPYLPNEGETIMFRGQSHDDGGIGVTYGDNPVEVESGEPAMKTDDGNALTVFGDLIISPINAKLLEDSSAKNKKFKNYVANLSKLENKQNKIIEDSKMELSKLDISDSYDKLKQASFNLKLQGADMRLKDIANKKMKAAELQTAINDTATEMNIDASELAKGNVKKLKTSKNKIAQDGYKIIGKNPGSIDYNEPDFAGGMWSGENYNNQWLPKVNDAFSNQERADEILNQIQNYSGQDYQDVRNAIGKFKTKDEQMREAYRLATDRKVGPYHRLVNDLIDKTTPSLEASIKLPNESPAETVYPDRKEEYINNEYEVIDYKRNPLIDVFNTILPFIRPTNQEQLDPQQLIGEMFALSSNQLEPVQAQSYQPDLDIPYDISLQDQLNLNQSDYRAAQRMMGNNPAAQSMLNANKYDANSKILGEQFRLNQALRDGVYSKNRNTLNDAKLKNIALNDQQYTRQAQAKSNTKAVTQAALSSISDKYMKNKLENRTLGIYENMYNYRYDASGRAINMNPLFQPNMPYIYSPDGEITHVVVKDKNGKIVGYKPIDKNIPDSATPPYVPIENKKSGGNIVKSFKDKSLLASYK